MEIEKKILEELKRFNQINKYILNEQDPAALPPADPAAALPPADPAAAGGAPPADPAAAGAAPPADPAAGGTPPAGAEVPEPIDVEKDPDVEEVGDEEKDKEGEEDTEEIDITDLVNAQNDIKDKQDEIMDTLFSRLDDLQSKLENMDQIMNKINSLEVKFDRYREKTPEEKLELRSLDSYPYNQKLTDFFDDKKTDMEKSGKNEYVLTSDEVENFSPNEVKKTFSKYEEDEDENEFDL
jgi:hypothetical protein